METLTVNRLTPKGKGGVAVVQLCGNGAENLFRPLFCGSLVPNKPNFGRLALLNELCEEVVVHCVSETEIEIHSHGGELIVAAIEALLIQHGASVSTKPAQQVSPQLSQTLLTQREIAWQMLPFAPTERIAQILLDQYNGAEKAEHDYSDLANHLIEPYRVVLTGAVNAGKSSLLNAVLGFQRSIVNPAAGTTRDVVSSQTAIAGFPVAFYDTAGWRGGNAEQSSAIEAEGIERAKAALNAADLIVWVIDSSGIGDGLDFFGERGTNAAGVDNSKTLFCFNKIDLATKTKMQFSEDAVVVSALTGFGIDRFLDTVLQRLIPHQPKPKEKVILVAR